MRRIVLLPRKPKAYVVIDIESAVLDEAGHRRYQAMERWHPAKAGKTGRRGYKRHEDPLRTPRWVFQTIVTASMMILVEHPDGNFDVQHFVTLSAPELDERAIVAGVLKVLDNAPAHAELVSWAGMLHDVPVLVMAALRYGLTLPQGWLGFGGNDPARHIDISTSRARQPAASR